MGFNQKLEELLDFSLEDYPSSAYSLIEERPVMYSKFPEFFSFRYPEYPVYGLFEKVEVVTREWMNNRHMYLIAESFNISQLDTLRQLVDSLTDIYGADGKRNLWLSEDEKEAIALDNWEGRDWDFPNNEDIRAVTISLESNFLTMGIHEMGLLMDD